MDNQTWRLQPLIPFNVAVAGRYKLKYYFEMQVYAPGQLISSYLHFNPSGTYVRIFGRNQTQQNHIFQGEIEFDATPATFYFRYSNAQKFLPTNYYMEITLLNTEKEFQQMHPTIELSRYAPDWSVGNYLNYLKNQFNIDVTLDDFKKEITLNLNEAMLLNEKPSVISKSLSMKSYDIAANSSFVLKYQNEEDLALFITKNEIVPYSNQNDDFIKKIESKFKILPRNGSTTVLSQDVYEKEGVGLLIYDEFSAPFTAENTEDGYNLNIAGSKGIYETFFKRWLKFLVNASKCEITGYFTETEISKINKVNAVYINNQRFKIIDIETTQDLNNYQQVKMSLLTVNF